MEFGRKRRWGLENVNHLTGPENYINLYPHAIYISLCHYLISIVLYVYTYVSFSSFLFYYAFLIQMETGEEFSNFHFIRNWSPSHERSQIKISQFIKFELLSLECNRVEGFQKLEKLESLYGFNLCRHHLGIRDNCMEYGRPLTGHSLVTTQ